MEHGGITLAQKHPPQVVPTSQEHWRKLGYFFTFDEKTKEYKLIGSQKGIGLFLKTLQDFIDKPDDHIHIGPHWIEIAIGKKKIDNHAIYGEIDDLKKLHARIAKLGVGAHVIDDYAPGPYVLRVIVRSDDSFLAD